MGSGPELRVVADAAAVARAGADRLQQLVHRRPDAVLALPTGRTPIGFYDELARRCAAGELDLSTVRAFNLDELLRPRDDPRTFRAFMERHAWGRTGLRRERCDIPDSAAADPAAECERYERAIDAAGGIDLAILGLGADGHVAYNLPRPVPAMATHVVRLPDELAASLDVPREEWPLRAITMGLGTLLAARAILVVAFGSVKAEAVAALLRGGRDPEWPCSFLADHPRCEVVVDSAAGSE